MQVVGHRGCAGLLPENTLLGFRHAIGLGVDVTECDVHLTCDGEMVIMHDPLVDRTTDGHGPIAEKTFAEMRALDAGQGQQVPTLAEVLEVVRGHLPLLLELKGPGTAAPALAAVRAMGMLDQVTFTCFDFSRIREVRALEPAVQTGAIFGKPTLESPAEAVAAGANGMGAHHGGLTAELVAEAHRLGLPIRAWNPDTEADQRRAIALAPDGISTNRPDRLLHLLGRGPAPEKP